jgi:hypothetical protein
MINTTGTVIAGTLRHLPPSGHGSPPFKADLSYYRIIVLKDQGLLWLLLTIESSSTLKILNVTDITVEM